MRHKTRSLRPPIFPITACLMAILSETSESRHTLGFDGSAKKAIGPVNLAVIFKRYPRFEIKADNRRFYGQVCVS